MHILPVSIILLFAADCFAQQTGSFEIPQPVPHVVAHPEKDDGKAVICEACGKMNFNSLDELSRASVNGSIDLRVMGDAPAIPAVERSLDRSDAGGYPSGKASTARREKRGGPEYAAIIAECARKKNLEPEMIAGLIEAESGFNPKAVSPAGAAGLMQISPAVAAWAARRAGIGFSPADITKPEININLGTEYLSYLLEKFSRDGALAAYKTGQASLSRRP
ncbi:MAG: transglycosylase SLT domain-containing protein [Elusimicrobiales bacterium]